MWHPDVHNNSPNYSLSIIPFMLPSLSLCVKVKVILGEDREATGILLSIDGDDGIVRMELDDQLKILNLRFLGRLEHWEKIRVVCVWKNTVGAGRTHIFMTSPIHLHSNTHTVDIIMTFFFF